MKSLSLYELVAARREAGLSTADRVDGPDLIAVPVEQANARRRKLGLPEHETAEKRTIAQVPVAD